MTQPQGTSIAFGWGGNAGIGPEIAYSNAPISITPGGPRVTLTPATSDGGPVEPYVVLRWLALTRSLVRVDALVIDGMSPAVEVAVGDLRRDRWTWSKPGTVPAPLVNDDGSMLVAIRRAGPEVSTITVSLAVTALPIPAFQRDELFGTPGLAEPSAIDVDELRSTLWIASDDGVLGRADLSTATVEETIALAGDLEGVRWVPTIDMLLVLDETTGTLRVASPESAWEPFPLASATSLSPSPTAGGNGFEGLAVTSWDGDFSASILLANQDDPHAVYRGVARYDAGVSVEAGAALAPVNVSEVVWDWGSRRAFVLHGYVVPTRLVLLDPVTLVEDTSQQIVLTDLSAEGAAFSGNGDLWIANDTGGIVRYRGVP